MARYGRYPKHLAGKSGWVTGETATQRSARQLREAAAGYRAQGNEAGAKWAEERAAFILEREKGR